MAEGESIRVHISGFGVRRRGFTSHLALLSQAGERLIQVGDEIVGILNAE
jgi:hypothetical protein